MLKDISKYYWWCQIGGWVFWMALNIIMSKYFGRRTSTNFVIIQISFAVFGMVVTHLLRWVILKLNLLNLRLSKLIYIIPLLVASGVMLLMFLRNTSVSFLTTTSHHRSSFSPWPYIVASLLIMIWVMIYFVANYFQREQRLQIDKLQLESTVKELELSTLKSQLNPHFLFNSLNSIRALVDENPERARTAVTELSNILRGSMQIEKMETVELRQELKIIEDYLGLEQIRFEERLKVLYQVEKATLSLPIPPMMLQTLIENGIKHGIAKSVKGGLIELISRKTDDFHEIIIRNTGHLQESADHSGFGLKSTKQRLEILYKGQAIFDIKNSDENTVETTLKIPLSNQPLP